MNVSSSITNKEENKNVPSKREGQEKVLIIESDMDDDMPHTRALVGKER